MQIILWEGFALPDPPAGGGVGQPGCPPPSLPPPGGGAWFPPPAGAVFVGGRSPSRSSRRRGNGATRLPPSQPPPAGGKRPVPAPGGGGLRRRAQPTQTLCGRGYGGTWFPHVHVSPRLRDAQPTGAGESGGSLQRPGHAVLSSAARRYHAWMGTPALSPRRRAIHSMKSCLYQTASAYPVSSASAHRVSIMRRSFQAPCV